MKNKILDDFKSCLEKDIEDISSVEELDNILSKNNFRDRYSNFELASLMDTLLDEYHFSRNIEIYILNFKYGIYYIDDCERIKKLFLEKGNSEEDFNKQLNLYKTSEDPFLSLLMYFGIMENFEKKERNISNEEEIINEKINSLKDVYDKISIDLNISEELCCKIIDLLYYFREVYWEIYGKDLFENDKWIKDRTTELNLFSLKRKSEKGEL